MKIFAIDDEPLMLAMLVSAIEEACPEAELSSFRTPSALRKAAEEGLPDVVFMDITMPGTNGLELGRELLRKKPNLNVVFVTGFSDYTLSAMEMFASGYVMKPVDASQIARQLANLRHPIEENSSTVKIKTFGNFTVFVGDTPVKFRSGKSAELLAYLVDREGASLSRAEVAAVLYEDDFSRAVQADLSRSTRWLSEDLKSAGAPDLFYRNNAFLRVCPETFSCDLYDYIAGKEGAVFNGEYMEQYSWGEYRKGYLEKLRQTPNK